MFFFRKSNNKSEKKLRAVIFTWTRTGASSLTAILSTHPDIHNISEPFNPAQEYGLFVKDKNPREFKIILEHIWEKYNLIKHNHGLTGKQENFLLTKSANKVIFLWRKNASRRAVSQQLSKQTKI